MEPQPHRPQTQHGPQGPRPRPGHVWEQAKRYVVAVGVFSCGLAVGAALVYYLLGRPALDAARARMDLYEQDLAALRGRLDEALNTAAALEGRYRVEEGARRGLETSLRTAQQELGRAHDTIAFYEQLMPPGPKGAVSVRALDIERAGPHLKYRVLLMRSGAGDQPFEGRLQFLAQGRSQGQDVRVELQPATLPNALDTPGATPTVENGTATAAENDATTSAGSEAEAKSAAEAEATTALRFSEFQRSSGVLALPEGFEPLSVTVNVLEGRTLRVSRSVELPVNE